MNYDANLPLHITLEKILEKVGKDTLGEHFAVKFTSISLQNPYPILLASKENKKEDFAKKAIMRQLRSYFNGIAKSPNLDEDLLMTEIREIKNALKHKPVTNFYKRLIQETDYEQIPDAVIEGSRNYSEKTKSKRINEEVATTHLKISYNSIRDELEKIIY